MVHEMTLTAGQVTGAMVKTELTGVDSNTAFVLDFQKLGAQAILTCSINASAADPPLVIRFAKGQITVPHPIYKPPSFSVRLYGTEGTEERGPEEFAFEGGGWHFQADEVARGVRDGRTESELWGWDKSVLEMEVFDEVRRQGGYVFPPGVEQVVE